MKTKFCVSLIVMLGIGLVVSPAAEAGWGWNRDAGAKARGELVAPSTSSIARPYAYRSYGYPPAAAIAPQGTYTTARPPLAEVPTAASPLTPLSGAVVHSTRGCQR